MLSRVCARDGESLEYIAKAKSNGQQIALPERELSRNQEYLFTTLSAKLSAAPFITFMVAMDLNAKTVLYK